ncbi:MAG: hypothetical protein Kapaf2KO_22200 [Candidatus Kapaibacteriales bacterium]
MRFIISSIFFLVALITILSQSDKQRIEKSAGKVGIEALSFKADTTTSLELFVTVPYEVLKFRSLGEEYKAEYRYIIRLEDNSSRNRKEISGDRKILTDSYFSSQGGEGNADIIFEQINIQPGLYTIKVLIQDNKGVTIEEAESAISVPDFNQDYGISGILILSEVEEVNGKIKITPHFSDNIYTLGNGFFAMFETYGIQGKSDIELTWEIKGSDGNILDSKSESYKFKDKVQSERIFISPSEELPLSLLQLDISIRETQTGNDILANFSKILINFPNGSEKYIKNIDESIEYLALIAEPSLIDSLENLQSESDKIKGFFEFWEKEDPSPNTIRNEALEQYFSRIEFANQNFSTYAKGWLTDQGRVYVALGPPDDIRRNQQMGMGQQQLLVWIYQDIGNFEFIDRRGFGDYRLYRPMGFNQKYRYRGSGK